ncbi:fumarylacetoacetate hydrolase family protein [Glaciecola sp. KUL10]|uniref:fumarylacetoacetate hydrolase family protein n=1 Tax=Glaciecola sp. (strain KUL10) TaxID=2161813 RepID=UPI000D78583D|nr:fumarylacetoacetate hydrolase family protein [Glaciecola sp. KUL10]GBL03437.1 fumarylacetoacetate (FAA) hydrolase [Glaciecola sp. KUL10]
MLNSTKYQHRFSDNHEGTELPVGKVVCVGRNYLDHIKELGNEIPSQAIYFIKPSTAIRDMSNDIVIPQDKGACHNELELAFLVAKTLTKVTPEEVSESIAGVGLGLDLTLREEQEKLKEMGHPWERAKAFDGSCPLSEFRPWNELKELPYFEFSLYVNSQQRQVGDSRLMIRTVFELIADMSQFFTLEAGDVVLTGTPKGVGPLHVGDVIKATLSGYIEIDTRVVAA